MNTYQINPYVRLALHSTLTGQFHIRRRAIYDYELIYIEEGHFRLYYDEAEYLCHKGDILLLHPGVRHSFRYDGVDLVQPHIHFDLIYDSQSERIPISFQLPEQMSPAERMQIRPDVLPSDSPFLTIRNREEFLRCFYEIVNRCRNDRNEQASLYVKGLMCHLISDIICDNYADCITSPIGEADAIGAIKNYIDANYQKGIDIQTISSQFHFSRSYIEKNFKAAYGMTAIQYGNELRFHQAKHLLKNLTVTATSEILGFSSIYSFSRAFRKHFGISPSAFKKQHQTR